MRKTIENVTASKRVMRKGQLCTFYYYLIFVTKFQLRQTIRDPILVNPLKCSLMPSKVFHMEDKSDGRGTRLTRSNLEH